MVVTDSGDNSCTISVLDDWNEAYGEFEAVKLFMSFDLDEIDATNDEPAPLITTNSDAIAATTDDAIDDYQDQGIAVKVPVPREIIAEAKRRRDTAGRWSDSGEGHLEDYILDHLVTGWSVTPVYGDRP